MSPWSHILPFNSILIHDHSLLYVCEWLKWDQPWFFISYSHPFDSSSFSSTSSHSVLRLSGRSKEQKNYIISIKKPQLTINCRWRRKTARHYISTAADMIRARSCWHYHMGLSKPSPHPAPSPAPPLPLDLLVYYLFVLRDPIDRSTLQILMIFPHFHLAELQPFE